MSQPEIRPGIEAPRRSSAGFWLLLAVLAALACGYLLLGGPQRRRLGQHPAVGRHLPNLELQALTGDSQPVSLADLSGQVVLLNFWGTWCPPCREEYPHLASLATRLADRPKFRFLSVSCGYADDRDLDELRAATEKYLKQIQSRLPTYADQYAYTRRNLALALQDEMPYPTTVVLDGNGILRGVWFGYREGLTDEMEQLLGQLLAP